jgi:hypothetical protein
MLFIVSLSLSLSLSLSSNDIKLAHHDFVLWKGFILANVSVSWNSAMRCPVFNDSHVVCGDTFVCKIFQYTTVIKIHPFTNQKYVWKKITLKNSKFDSIFLDTLKKG